MPQRVPLKVFNHTWWSGGRSGLWGKYQWRKLIGMVSILDKGEMSVGHPSRNGEYRAEYMSLLFRREFWVCNVNLEVNIYVILIYGPDHPLAIKHCIVMICLFLSGLSYYPLAFTFHPTNSSTEKRKRIQKKDNWFRGTG